MDYTKLPDLRRVVRGFDMRMDAARAISQVEILHAGGSADTLPATDLRTFFIACANAVDKTLGGDGTRVAVGGVVLNSNQVVVTNGDAVVVHDNTGAVQAGSPATAEVANGVLTDVKLGATS